MNIYGLMAAILGLSLAAGGGYAEQIYPTKPIRLIVPFPAGGQTDVVARTLSQKLADAFGQSVVVDNRPGAAGSIGAELAVRASPDGYTMVQVSTSYAANAALYKLQYDPLNAVVPIVMIGEIAKIIGDRPRFHRLLARPGRSALVFFGLPATPLLARRPRVASICA